LPVDAVVAKTFAANAPSRVAAVDSVGSDEMTPHFQRSSLVPKNSEWWF